MFKRLFGNPSSSSASSGRPSSSSSSKGGSGGSGSTTSGRAAFDAVDKLKDVRLLKSVSSGGFDFVRSFVRSFARYMVSLFTSFCERRRVKTTMQTRAVVLSLSSEDLFFSFFASIFNITE